MSQPVEDIAARRAGRSMRFWLLQTLIVTTLALAITAMFVKLRFGRISAALGFLRGQHIVATESEKSLGEIQPGETRDVLFDVTNTTTRPLTLIGATTTCSCTVVENLPLTIPGASEQTVRVRVRIREKDGPWSEKLQLLTDDSAQPRLTLRLVGHLPNRVVK